MRQPNQLGHFNQPVFTVYTFEILYYVASGVRMDQIAQLFIQNGADVNILR